MTTFEDALLAEQETHDKKQMSTNKTKLYSIQNKKELLYIKPTLFGQYVQNNDYAHAEQYLYGLDGAT